ncbi:HupE/UreJ family protein [Mucilaginibacter calamicampi]|uniref:HupE/UreJ family protein n=1 Tax=Mucilaginibacter calamicampi TaxID=1302352 RepID=A0ABW2YXG4_9SPHI
MRKYILSFLLLFAVAIGYAHPMPASVVKLSVMDGYIKGEAKMPLPELESAINHPVDHITTDPYFRIYFADHIKAFTGVTAWRRAVIRSVKLTMAQDAAVGKYQQVEITFELTPAKAADLRQFTFDYDVIMHQVITHEALVLLQQDWYTGLNEESAARVIGTIKLDVPSGKIYPLSIKLEEGSTWKGFVSMMQLGMQHIKEGTDHLLFLIVLLLPAMLIAENKKWGRFGGLKYSLTNLIKIVTAFTIGHSITLLLCASGWLNVPSQPIEILIAGSILVSAAHAVRPLFPGREVYIAAGFGLIHGMAFASVLAGLDLNVSTLALSILGFNLGIELMQLFIILIIAPWLILLSRTNFYALFRIPAAVLAGIAALGWIAERVTGRANAITIALNNITPYAPRLIILLAITACLFSIKLKRTQRIDNQ